MGAWTATTKKDATHPHGAGVWILQATLATIITGFTLFLLAGTLKWEGGWAFFGLNFFVQLLSSIILIRRKSDLLEERTKTQTGTKNWDKVLAPAVMLAGTLGLIVTASLDVRFGWSKPIHPVIRWASLAFALASQLFVLWAMVTNRFFATTVRIQSERDHQVVNTGPYRLVRHPGYAGSVLYNLVIPIVLGSWWAFIPALLTVLLLIVRTRLEDRTLQAELPGYEKFMQETRYRLLPGCW